MTDYTIASPNGGAWSINNTNTSKDGRFVQLAGLLEGASGSGNVFTRARAGILPGPPGATATQISGGGLVAPVSGLTFSIQPFAAVVERGGVGPYLVESTAVGSAAVGTADPSQTRVDRVDVRVLDGALGDNGGVSLIAVKVTAGTPGAGLPSAPTNSIPLGAWNVSAGATTLTSGMWVPSRKSAGIRGGVRLLMEGDLLTDPGFMSGELRDTTAVAAVATIDRWNSVTSTWQRIVDLSGAAVAQNAFPGAMGSSGSVTYVVPANTAGVAFKAPASGIVEVEWSADLRSSALNVSAILSPQVFTGATVGSGGVFQAANDNQSVSTNSQTNNTSVGSSVFVTGLTPGSSYNVQLFWRATNSGTAAGSNARVLVSPQAA